MPTVTIDTTAPQAAEVADCLGEYLNLRNAQGALRNATPAEVRAFLVQDLRSMVRVIKKRRRDAALVDPDFDLT